MNTIIVGKSEKIKSINEALNYLKEDDENTIFLKKGIYEEKIRLNSSNLVLEGESKDEVIILYHDYSKKIHEDKRDYNTFRTATIMVLGNNITFKNLTIKNDIKANFGGQAVALSIFANHFKAININILSEQDTLLLGPLPDDLKERYTNFLTNEELFIEGSLYSKFDNCYIEGNIDFIFGSGEALFRNCSLISNGKGYVSAPSHSLFQKYGFNFINCNYINKQNDIDNVYIARPWRSYGKNVVINCSFDKHIKKDGYTSWNNKHPENYIRFIEYPLNHTYQYLKTLSTQELNDYLDELNKVFNF